MIHAIKPLRKLTATGRGKGREECDHGARQGDEWTSEGGGEARLDHQPLTDAPVIRAARMLVREDEPAWPRSAMAPRKYRLRQPRLLEAVHLALQAERMDEP